VLGEGVVPETIVDLGAMAKKKTAFALNSTVDEEEGGIGSENCRSK